jgi:hypothetical protein
MVKQKVRIVSLADYLIHHLLKTNKRKRRHNSTEIDGCSVAIKILI